LLLDANAGEAAENVELVGKILKLYEFNLPGTLLLLNDGLQSSCGVAMSTAGIVEDHVDFLH
jgi:hypothetical protein